MEQSTWILVADRTIAKVFCAFKAKLFNAAPSNDVLKKVMEFQNPDGRKKDSDLVSDKQGRFGSGTFVEPTDPKKHEDEIFARKIMESLNEKHNEHHFHELIMVAPPAFMGMLNKQITLSLQKLVTKTIEKDYVHLDLKEFVTQIQKFL